MKNSLDTTFDHKDPYKILGVSAEAPPVVIRTAYLALAKRNHQDLFATNPEKYRSSTLLMQDINSAYELLSDPTRRVLWDRKHQRVPRQAPRPTPTPTPTPHYESELVHVVIQKYNRFVDSLRTPEQRREAVRRIHRFRASRDGSAYIRKLVASCYQGVIDIINRDRRVDRPFSVFDDGLVELTFLYEDTLEVSPSDVFITYAYILFQENGGKVPAAPGAEKQPRRGPATAASRVPMLMLRDERVSKGPTPAKDVNARIWKWLMSKPEPRRRPTT